MNFDWKILEITCDGEKITHAKYYCKATEGELFVETEGNAYGDFSFGIPYKEITQENVLNSVKNLYVQGDSNLIELNLKNQLNNMSVKTVSPPWHVDTFKVEV